MANWTYDPSQYEEKNFTLIPAGDYRVRVADVVEKTFSTGSNGYEITLDVNGYSAKVWFYLVLDASNPGQTNQRIGDFFNSFGISNPAMGSGKQWIGAVGAVRIKHEDFQGSPRAKMAYCLNRDRQANLAPWKELPGGAPAAAAPAQAPVTGGNVEIPADLPFDM